MAGETGLRVGIRCHNFLTGAVSQIDEDEKQKSGDQQNE
jgi:hypothetical protein